TPIIRIQVSPLRLYGKILYGTFLRKRPVFITVNELDTNKFYTNSQCEQKHTTCHKIQSTQYGFIRYWHIYLLSPTTLIFLGGFNDGFNPIDSTFEVIWDSNRTC